MNFIQTAIRSVAGYDKRKQWSQFARRVSLLGRARYCPCCQTYLRRFTPFGLIKREEAKCPSCGSLERHRLIYLYLKERTDLFDERPKKLLHIAPEPQLSSLLQSTKHIDYLSADLMSPTAMVKMDITDIQYPDNSFDIIYCSHVLEHVPDDKLAMREFHRVLKPGGWAILQVPITADVTIEDPSITDPKERERLFGQHDHVRRYGPDYRDRLVEAGFAVQVDPYVRQLGPRNTRRFGLIPDEDIYFCTKPAATD